MLFGGSETPVNRPARDGALIAPRFIVGYKSDKISQSRMGRQINSFFSDYSFVPTGL